MASGIELLARVQKPEKQDGSGIWRAGIPRLADRLPKLLKVSSPED
jgi:hypothetical protein